MANFIESDRSIDQYVSEINAYPLLSREDEVSLANEFKQSGDRKAAHRLIVSNLRFVVKVAHEYRGYNLKLLDLVQEGNIGLMMAVRKFEPAKGYRLISYAVWWIRAYIQNFIMRSWSLVKLGTTQAQRKLFFKLRSERERAERQSETGERADAAEMAARLNVHAQEITDMDMRLGSRDFSLDLELQEGARQSHLDLLPNPDCVADQEGSYAQSEERAVLHSKVREQMKVLNDKERYIIRNRLMTDEPKTLQEIGQHFSISRERARQIEGNVIRKMRNSLVGSGIEPHAMAC
jgi:RNA polymerase sigma-32 factor